LFDFKYEALVPNFIEGLAEFQEDSGAGVLFFESFVDYVSKTVALLNSCMFFAEPKLVCRHPILKVCFTVNSK
jgi:hypothetical protein